MHEEEWSDNDLIDVAYLEIERARSPGVSHSKKWWCLMRAEELIKELESQPYIELEDPDVRRHILRLRGLR